MGLVARDELLEQELAGVLEFVQVFQDCGEFCQGLEVVDLGLAGEVRRDIHKMRAFVRFREIGEEDDATRFVAWFEP